MKSLLRILGLVIIVLGLRIGMANGTPLFCTGACTVYCDSGATYGYLTRDYQCCAKVSVCPDGGYAIWEPGTGVACLNDPALIC